MRVVGAVILSALLALPAGAAELLPPGQPAGVRGAQETSYHWLYMTGGGLVVAGVAYLIAKNNSSTDTVLKISNGGDQVSPVISPSSTISTGSTN